MEKQSKAKKKTKKTKKKNCRLLTEKLDDIGARLEHTPGKSQKRLAQEP
jgi:hypothetical protein